MKDILKNKIYRTLVSVLLSIFIPVPIYDSCMSACGDNFEGVCLMMCVSGFRFKSVVGQINDLVMGIAVNDIQISGKELAFVLVGSAIYSVILFNLIKNLIKEDK